MENYHYTPVNSAGMFCTFSSNRLVFPSNASLSVAAFEYLSHHASRITQNDEFLLLSSLIAPLQCKIAFSLIVLSLAFKHINLSPIQFGFGHSDPDEKFAFWG